MTTLPSAPGAPSDARPTRRAAAVPLLVGLAPGQMSQCAAAPTLAAAPTPSPTLPPHGLAAASVITILGLLPPVMATGPYALTKSLMICWAAVATLGLEVRKGRRSGACVCPSLDCVSALAHDRFAASGSVEASWSLVVPSCLVGGHPPLPHGARGGPTAAVRSGWPSQVDTFAAPRAATLLHQGAAPTGASSLVAAQGHGRRAVGTACAASPRGAPPRGAHMCQARVSALLDRCHPVVGEGGTRAAPVRGAGQGGLLEEE